MPKVSVFFPAVLALTAMFSGSVSADVVIFSKNIVKKTTENGVPYYSESGVSGEDLPVISGGGDKMSLSLALKLITPKSWDVEVSGKEANKTITSWEGGTTFSHILRRISENNEIFIDVDWVQKKINIHNPDAVENKFRNSGQIETSAALPVGVSAKKTYTESPPAQNTARNDDYVVTANKNKRIESLITTMQSSEQDHESLIATLHKRNRNTNQEKEDLNNELQSLKAELKQAKSLIQVVHNSENTKTTTNNPIELHEKHGSRYVLPFDDSFDYFLKGGHQDTFDPMTPATYLAKVGTVEDILKKWAHSVGYVVDYKVNVRHNIKHKMKFKGNFIESSKSLIKKFINSKRPLNISFHPKLGESGVVLVEDLNFSKPNQELNSLLNQ
ncbi:MAG: hypothetical protein HAW67_03770 [Endozoicomonadaceae bacterium]|nr:hypothetical protein [Endozoicomonadaceae bacterium]